MLSALIVIWEGLWMLSLVGQTIPFPQSFSIGTVHQSISIKAAIRVFSWPVSESLPLVSTAI